MQHLLFSIDSTIIVYFISKKLMSTYLVPAYFYYVYEIKRSEPSVYFSSMHRIYTWKDSSVTLLIRLILVGGLLCFRKETKTENNLFSKHTIAYNFALYYITSDASHATTAALLMDSVRFTSRCFVAIYNKGCTPVQSHQLKICICWSLHKISVIYVKILIPFYAQITE